MKRSDLQTAFRKPLSALLCTLLRSQYGGMNVDPFPVSSLALRSIGRDWEIAPWPAPVAG
jgi:hypothetical protein